MSVSGDKIRFRVAESAAPTPGTSSAEGRPQRRPWFHFIRRWAVSLWLAITAAGIVAAAIPATFPAKVLLSSAVLGAGVAGLMSEFTYSIDRRDSNFELQTDKQYQDVLKRQVTSLEHQVGQVDMLVQKTEIIAINQLFELSIYLYLSRFGDARNLEEFRATIIDLGDILKIPNDVRRFLQNPYFRPSEVPPEGKDPYPYLVGAIRLRYSSAGVEAFQAAMAIGSLITAPLDFVDQDSRAPALSILRIAIPKLYLLPQVSENIMNAIQGLDENAADPESLAAYVGYFSLFSNYLEYRMNGRQAEVAPLFEIPTSPTEPATVERIRRLIAQMAGESPGNSSGSEIPATEAPALVWEEQAGTLTTGQVEPKSWISYLRKWALLFWFLTSVAGLVVALSPAEFGAKDLLTSAVVGAGIAGLISEFTVCPDRRDADFTLRYEREYDDALELQVAALEHQVGQVDVLLKNSEIVTLNQLFVLGIDVYMTYFGTVNMGLAEDLADILGLRSALAAFFASQRDPTAVNRGALKAYKNLTKAVQLRYAENGVAAYEAGAAVGGLLVLPESLFDPRGRELLLSRLKNAVPQLYLLPTACKNMLDAIHDLENGTCHAATFIGYISAFVYYLTYRLNGGLSILADLFESPMSLTRPTANNEIMRALELAIGPYASGLAGAPFSEVPDAGPPAAAEPPSAVGTQPDPDYHPDPGPGSASLRAGRISPAPSGRWRQDAEGVDGEEAAPVPFGGRRPGRPVEHPPAVLALGLREMVQVGLDRRLVEQAAG
jgi:hypothetical protein